MKKIYTTFLSLLALTSAMAQVPVPTTGLVSEYTFTGNANDGVGSVNGSVTGGTLVADRFGNASSAYNLASGQFIGLGDNFDNITTGSNATFSFSFWVKFSNVNSAYHSIINKASFETLCTTAGRQFTIRLNDANKLELTGYGSITAGNYVTYQTASTLSSGQWYHVVMGVDMALLSGGNIAGGLKVYVNNTLQTMSQATLVGGGLGSGMGNGTAHMGIGAFLGTAGAICSATQYLEGAFDDFRVYNRVLTAQDANDLYYENVLQGGLVSRYSFNAGDATDDEGSNDGTVTGAALTTDRFGNPNQAYAFDGNDYINCGNNSTWNLLLSPGITMSAWVKTNATFGASLAGILTRWGGTSSSDEYAFFLANTTGRQTMAINTPSVNGVAATTNINDNVWHQVVFTFDKATGVHKMYVDGVQTYTNTIAGGIATITVPQSVVIGAQWTNGTPTRYFNGSIDDIGVYAEALTAQEVSTLYNQEAFGCNPAVISQDLNSVNYFCPEVGSVDLCVTATGDNLTYQWQSSPDGSTGTDIY
ncbi:MAG: LamG domain-containing protein, partial [Bacteroidia bacterium]